MNKLSGRVALVTGSSRGIGAAIARRFAAEGADLVLHGRDRDALAAAAKDIGQPDRRIMTVTADVTRFDDIEQARRQIEEEFGHPDILVANAGGNVAPPRPLEEIEEDGWRATVEENLTATFLTIKSFLPGMKAGGRGSIITISSSAARKPDARSPIPYAAAKAGIELLTKEVAAQAGSAGVRANCIAPDTILTERNLQLIPAEQIPHLIDHRPIRRLGTPDDIANAALFLASEDAGWITGVVLDLAGGAVMQ